MASQAYFWGSEAVHRSTSSTKPTMLRYPSEPGLSSMLPFLLVGGFTVTSEGLAAVLGGGITLTTGEIVVIVGSLVVGAYVIVKWAIDPYKIIDTYRNPTGDEIPLREGNEGFGWEHIKQKHPELFDDKTEEEVQYEIKRTIRNPSETWYDANGDVGNKYFYIRWTDETKTSAFIAIIGRVGLITFFYTSDLSYIYGQIGPGRPFEVRIF